MLDFALAGMPGEDEVERALRSSSWGEIAGCCCVKVLGKLRRTEHVQAWAATSVECFMPTPSCSIARGKQLSRGSGEGVPNQAPKTMQRSSQNIGKRSNVTKLPSARMPYNTQLNWNL